MMNLNNRLKDSFCEISSLFRTLYNLLIIWLKLFNNKKTSNPLYFKANEFQKTSAHSISMNLNVKLAVLRINIINSNSSSLSLSSRLSLCFND